MTASGGQSYSASLTLLIDRLEQIPSLRDPASRRLCLDLMVDRIGFSLVVEEFPSTRTHLIAIVQACRRHPRALGAFMDAVEQMEPNSIPVQQARGAVDDMTALELVGEDDRKELLTFLEEDPSDRLTDFVRAAAGPAAVLVADEQYPAEALATLEQLNAGPDEVPPLLFFVELLAAYLDDHRGERLRGWNDRQAGRAGLTDQLRKIRQSQLREPTPLREAIAYIVIRIEPDHLDGDLFSVTHWRQNNPDEWRPQRGGTVTGDLTVVRQYVSSLVDDAESGWARLAKTIRIEFVLPFSLISLPVDQWEVDVDSPVPRTLGVHYQLVVRSLDRARSPKWHREWRRRWEALTTASDESGTFEEHWLWSDVAKARQLTALDAKLAVSKDVVALVLRSAPDEEQPGEVVVGLRAGVPVMLWSRTDGGRAAFEAKFKELRDALPKLIESLQLVRSEAKQTARPNGHVGSRTTLLWDDPDRPVEPVDPPGAPTEEVSL
ncbi:MAG: hypothetical protein WBA97_22410 [Actinophytocola sp.]|uniref:VMAP-C domain-containing protein n=1 Tax=Actinophytocola sp. TaxID=1872138 RepID=UPI003C72C930